MSFKERVNIELQQQHKYIFHIIPSNSTWEDSSWMEVSKILEYIDIDGVCSMNTLHVRMKMGCKDDKNFLRSMVRHCVGGDAYVKSSKSNTLNVKENMQQPHRATHS